ncbi:MAG: enoyl-CoA hydratase/isomerase family protein [Thalassotalea sp.]|nr:enoyl-CoA hydratase/isomerase family protein [Thalassotalea sp.]
MQDSLVKLPVILEEKLLKNGLRIAFATLNAPKSLNALSLPMIDVLLPQLKTWLSNTEIALIVIQGAGDKAFCAGGDVVSIYHDLAEKHQKNARSTLNDDEVVDCLGIEFFTKEYELDLLIHNATKPILVWADGYVMGGGIGLVAGASHRVVTEKTVMAMPEITIGLYPDVGASWFLNQMPQGVGLFLGLTGMTFNGLDARFLKLAEHIVNSDKIDYLNDSLLEINWTATEKNNHQLLSELLNKHDIGAFSRNKALIEQEIETIQSVSSFDNIIDIYNAIVNTEISSEWFSKAQSKLRHGSPLSAQLIYHQLINCQHLSKTECFEQEFNLSVRCCQFSEFSEGVRALLVEKDKQPQWFYKNIESVEEKLVNWFFTKIQH